MTNKLTLRTVNSPYGDFTKGSVLSQTELDENQIFLKGDIIYSSITTGGTVTLFKYNGNNITFSSGTGTDTFITGSSLSTGYTLTLYRNDGVDITTNLAGLVNDVYVLSGVYDPNTGVITYTNSTGGTFQVSGFVTGFTDNYTTGVTLSNNILSFDRTGQLSAYSVNISGSTTYTNTAATPSTIGGITAGSTFNGLTMQQMFDSLLYPYQVPAFSSFSLGISSPREIGNEITPSQTFTWGTTNSSNVSANTVTIAGYNLTTLTGLANDGNEPVTFISTINRTAVDGPGTRAWSIQATNTHSGLLNGSLSIRWDWRMYAGRSSSTALTETDIEALSNFNSVKNGFAGTYNLSAGGYKYFCFATGYGVPATFVDTSNNLNVAMYTGYPNIDIHGNSYDLVSVTNAQGETTNYKVYRTLNILGSTISIALT